MVRNKIKISLSLYEINKNILLLKLMFAKKFNGIYNNEGI